MSLCTCEQQFGRWMYQSRCQPLIHVSTLQQKLFLGCPAGEDKAHYSLVYFGFALPGLAFQELVHVSTGSGHLCVFGMLLSAC